MQGGKIPKALEELIKEEEEEKADQELQVGGWAGLAGVRAGGLAGWLPGVCCLVCAAWQLVWMPPLLGRDRIFESAPLALHADLSFNCCLLPARLAAAAWPPATACPQIPAHKVKLVVGAGGEKIKFIQKKRLFA